MSITSRLRRTRIPAALLCASAFLAACQDSVVAPAVPSAATLSDPLAQRIAGMGFRPESIVDAGDHFVVEGDILFRKADLQGAPRMSASPLAGGPSYHYHTTSLVPQSMMAQGIPVNLSGITSNSAWTTAARNAIAAWNGTSGTKIKFVEVTSNAYINFSFRTSSSTAGVAQGGFPVNGYPGGAVIINPYYNSLSASKKQNAMVHELGHTIGHRHTDWASADPPGGTEGAVHIPGTPTGSESASVMYSVNHNWNGFTANDQTANRYMYPVHAPVITSQGYDGSGNYVLSWNPVPDAAQYRISYDWWFEEWVVDPFYYPNGGYYAWTPSSYDITTTSSTTFTDPGQGTGASPYACSYYVVPIYPNGKTGYGVRSGDVTC